MKKLKITVAAISLIVYSHMQAEASFLHAPHNEENQISCVSCHEYSYAPPYAGWISKYGYVSGGTVDNTITNFICLRCHGPSATVGMKKGMHSSLAMTSHYPNWTTQCVDCHDPHFQSQLQYSAMANFYLVKGTIMNKTFSATPTRITMLSAGTMTVVAGWENPALWSGKTSPQRGLILVPNTSSPGKTYEIVGATYDAAKKTGTIQVSGEVTEPNGAQFGVFFGQLLKDRIIYNSGYSSINARVQMFNPNGGFVDTVSSFPLDPPTGICQVCHTKTTRYRNTGVMPALTDTHALYNMSDCSDCHSTGEGFKPTGGGHADYDFGFDGTCIICHDNDGNQTTKPPVVGFVHGNNCAVCHTNPSAGDYTRKNGDPSFGVDGDARLAVNRSAICSVCHPTSFTKAGSGAIHHVSKNGYAAAANCTYCHASTKIPANHSTYVSSSASCAGCHPATAGTTTGIPLSATDSKVHDSCITCHNTDGKLKAPYGKAVAMPAGGGPCINCHGDYFPNHTHHNTTPPNDVRYNATTDTSQASRTGCASCHNDAGTALANWNAILIEHDTDGVKDGSINTCAKCHNYAGNKSAPLAAVQNAIASGNPATCATCHTDKVPATEHGGHAATDFAWTTQTQTTCGTALCHNATANVNVIATVHKNLCTHCHTTSSGGDGTAKVGARALGDARLGSTAPPHADSCLVCHGSGYMTTTTTSTYRTTESGTTYGGAHHKNIHAQKNDCGWCHVDPRPNWASTYGVTGPADIKQLACVTCHAVNVGNDLVIYENYYQPTATVTYPSGFNNVAVGGAATVQQRQIHRITATQGTQVKVYNYGMCLSCHTKLLYHGRPNYTKDDKADTSDYNQVFDVLRYAPGRAKFNLFRANFRQPNQYYKSGASTNEMNRGKNVYKAFQNGNWANPAGGTQQLTFNTATNVPCFAMTNGGKCTNGTSVSVPYFNDIPAPVITASLGLSPSSSSSDVTGSGDQDDTKILIDSEQSLADFCNSVVDRRDPEQWRKYLEECFNGVDGARLSPRTKDGAYGR